MTSKYWTLTNFKTIFHILLHFHLYIVPEILSLKKMTVRKGIKEHISFWLLMLMSARDYIVLYKSTVGFSCGKGWSCLCILDINKMVKRRKSKSTLQWYYTCHGLFQPPCYLFPFPLKHIRKQTTNKASEATKFSICLPL